MLLLERHHFDDAPLAVNCYFLSGPDQIRIEDRRIFAALWCLETIAEPRLQQGVCRSGCIGVDALPGVVADDAHIIDAMGVVGMVMGVEDGVDMSGIGVEQLLANIGAGIDQDAGGGTWGARFFNKNGAAQPCVFRVSGITLAPIAANSRHAAG